MLMPLAVPLIALARSPLVVSLPKFVNGESAAPIVKMSAPSALVLMLFLLTVIRESSRVRPVATRPRSPDGKLTIG
jgi:hypothetical protein